MRTVALPPDERSAPGEAAPIAPPGPDPRSESVLALLGLSLLVFLFTATIGFALVWAIVS